MDGLLHRLMSMWETDGKHMGFPQRFCSASLDGTAAPAAAGRSLLPIAAAPQDFLTFCRGALHACVTQVCRGLRKPVEPQMRLLPT